MDLQLQDKHVLITGGSKGIGLACARGFLQEGSRVTLLSRSQDNLDAAAKDLRAEFPSASVQTVAGDLQQAGEGARTLDAAEAAHGAVDILVNSAGAAQRRPAPELTPQYWHDAMNAKYFTYIHMIDPVIKRMAQRGAGAIVNIVGNGGKVANPTHIAGGAANAALMLASAGLASAYASQGVRVNAVNPGPTATDRLIKGLSATARADGISVDEARLRSTAGIPMGRVGTPQEVANAVVFLASSQASYITGIVLTMDGAKTAMVV